MTKNKILTFLIFSIAVFSALPAPARGEEAAAVIAPAYATLDVQTGKILLEKNSGVLTIPASLTKMVTAMVVLDTNPDIKKSIAITRADQDMGACGRGGGCMKTRVGAEFTIDALLHAALLPSDNNAAAAIARSTGMSNRQFASKMNEKVRSLGAHSTNFVEPTGMSSHNITTAADFARIMAAALAHPHLRIIGKKTAYYLASTNDAKYNRWIRSSNGLFGVSGLTMYGGKTGYLHHKYNFASVLTPQGGRELSIVVLQDERLYSAFNDTIELAAQAVPIQQELARQETIEAVKPKPKLPPVEIAQAAEPKAEPQKQTAHRDEPLPAPKLTWQKLFRFLASLLKPLPVA